MASTELSSRSFNLSVQSPILISITGLILRSGVEMDYILPTLLLSLANVVFWFKGNSKDLFGLEWSPLQWWLYTSLLTNYMTLYAWWKLIEVGDVWRAGVTWGLCSLTIDLILNSYYFGFNPKGVLALCLCGVAALIVHS